jgi:hypothetical protein
MCAGCFLPLTLYGPGNAVIQGLVPPQLRSTVAGFNMMVINLFAIALGNFAIGFASDRLMQGHAGMPLTTVLVTADALALCCGPLFWLAARCLRRAGLPRMPAGPAAAIGIH